MHAVDAGTRVMVQLRKGLRVAGLTRRVLHGFSHQLASPVHLSRRLRLEVIIISVLQLSDFGLV